MSLADLTYASNTTGMCYPGRVPDGSLPQSCDLSGEHPIDAPPWVITAMLQHVLPPAGAASPRGLTCHGRINTTPAFRRIRAWSRSQYFDLGLRLALEMGDRYELVLWGDNLLDENVSHIDSVLNFLNDASYQSYLTEPRSFGMTVRIRY